MPKYLLENYGCRASQADGAAIEASLARAGYSTGQGDADVVVLNTCTVTASADTEVRAAVRRIQKSHPGARIVVTGCYAQRAPEEVAALPGVSLVVGNSRKSDLVQLLEEEPIPYHGAIHVGDIFEATEFFAPITEGPLSDRSRPNLKIQDGCNNRCSFCIIPFVRGRSRSARVDDVIEQVRHLASRYAEVVLTGINLGRWGREPGSKLRLADLVSMLLEHTDVARLRLSSVEPMDWSDDLLTLVADSPRIAKHVHAPLQSGSDTVLRRMHRKYRPRHYEDRIRKAREWVPDAAIGADVMTGFPGESEDEFQSSCEFVESLPFTYLHVFPYSERPGTPAASARQVPQHVRKERARVLQAIATRKNREFRERAVGRTFEAAVLQDPRFGLTSNYLRVEFAAPRSSRTLVPVEIGGLSETGLREVAPFPIVAGQQHECGHGLNAVP